MHSLCGASSVIGAVAMALAARELEARLAGADDAEELARQGQALDVALRALVAQIVQRLDA
nr:hypothetical protein [Rubrivivax sp. A210]